MFATELLKGHITESSLVHYNAALFNKRTLFSNKHSIKNMLKKRKKK